MYDHCKQHQAKEHSQQQNLPSVAAIKGLLQWNRCQVKQVVSRVPDASAYVPTHNA
jgi:hypothetical protein